MLTKIAFSGLMLSMLALPLLAQQTTMPTAETTASNQRGNRMQDAQMADPATRAQRQSARMAKMLNLDEATSKKVYDADLARTQKVDEIMKGSDDNKTKQKALKANADEYKAKLQTILTPDQLTKIEQMQDQMKDRMRNRQGNNGDMPNNN